MATGAQSPYEYYLELLGNWSTNIALPTLWYCHFHLDSVNCLKGTLNNQLGNYESALGNNGWGINKESVKHLIDGRLQYATDSLIGCVFAKQVNLPGELIKTSHEGLDYGGFMAPATTNGRRDVENLQITLLETNLSFLDLVIRPWSILVGYNGFVARSKKSIKNVKCSQCDIVMLSKAGPDNPLSIRKIFRFYNIAPMDISGESYSHMTDALKTTQVNFAYDGYTVLG